MKKAICIVAQDNDISPIFKEYDKFFKEFIEKEHEIISQLNKLKEEHEEKSSIRWGKIESVLKERGVQYDDSTQFLEYDEGVLFVCDNREEEIEKEEKSRLVEHIFKALKHMAKND